MDKNKITINILKSFKDKLLEKENKRKKCDIRQFYEDSLNFLNVTNGMVILITESEEIRKNGIRQNFTRTSMSRYL